MRCSVPAEPLNVLSGEGSRTDDAHLPSANIDELQQFVNSRPAQPCTDAGNLSIPHAAKLEYGERMTIAADAWLPEEGRAAIVEPNGNCNAGDQRREDNACCACDDEVKGAFSAILAS